MLQQSIKESLIAFRVEQLITCCSTKTKSWSSRPFLTPSSHSRKGRITRGRKLSSYLIGGSQTVKHYQHSRTCCVKCSPTHPTLAHLSVPLASSSQLTMTIRRSLAPTTFNYPCRHSLTNEHCSSRVSSDNLGYRSLSQTKRKINIVLFFFEKKSLYGMTNR